jgi:hypothetical protein
VHGVERTHGLPAARRQARRRHGSGLRYLDNLYEEYPGCAWNSTAPRLIRPKAAGVTLTVTTRTSSRERGR